ncbi:RDD family protein [Paenibacillus sp. GCM10023252]|uniref:RDD family protein n=1 Tax=Paenibacillus sp. GCM10023252 TaxID=3252649 RepID=UPI003618FCB2
MKKASLPSRFFASLIDVYIIVSAIIILTFIVMNGMDEATLLSTIIVVIIMISGVSALVFKDVLGGRSIGKRIFNLGVRGLDGSIPSTKKLISRNRASFFWPRDVYQLLLGKDKRRQGDINHALEVYQLGSAGTKTSRALRIILSISLIVIVMVGGFTTMIKQNASYKTAIVYIANDKAVQEVIGEPIRFGFFPQTSISMSNGYGEATFRLKATGDKDSVIIYIMLHKEPNKKWVVKTMNYH